MHDLSYGLAKRYIDQAENINYQLRSNGLNYNYANALYMAGQNELALVKFKEVIEKSKVYNQIPLMNWYKRNGLLRLSQVYWQLGKYKEGLEICEQFKELELLFPFLIDIIFCIANI